MIKQTAHTLEIRSAARGLLDITRDVASWVRRSGFELGLLTLFVRHTSASLLIQENADPQVQVDLERFLARLVPDGEPLFEHTQEGSDDMPAHVRAALTQTHLSIPLVGGRLVLGTWQAIYLYEHRREGQLRQVVLHLSGE